MSGNEKSPGAGYAEALDGTEVDHNDTIRLTEDAVILDATKTALVTLRAGDLPADPFDAAQQLERLTNTELRDWRKRQQLSTTKQHRLTPEQAFAITELYLDVRLIEAADPAMPMLAVYDAADGLYVDCSANKHSNPLVKFLRSLVATAPVRWIDECVAVARSTARVAKVANDRHLVALDNGVYDMSTGELMPYSPELVFMAKARTAMPASEPELPVIDNGDGTTWDPQTWLLSTMGCEALANVIIELVGWCLRPRAFADDKFVVFHAKSGSNGKGTILKLLRMILGGPDALGVRSIPLENFGKDSGSFLLSPLVGAVANLCDESDGNTFMESSSTLKAITSHDPIMVNRKNRDPIEVELYVPMIFSLNELPRMKDRSGAVDRRMHIVPFGARFMSSGTAVAKNPRIKAEYIERDDVREWFVWQALVALGAFTSLSSPPEIDAALASFREENVGAVAFWAEYGAMFSDSPLDFLPFQMMHESHAEQALRAGARGVEKIGAFTAQIIELAEADGWRVETGADDRNKRYANRWRAHHATWVRPIIGDLGLSSIERTKRLSDDDLLVEYVQGSVKVARWTYTYGDKAGVRRRTSDLPRLLAGLVRDRRAVSLPSPDDAAPAPSVGGRRTPDDFRDGVER